MNGDLVPSVIGAVPATIAAFAALRNGREGARTHRKVLNIDEAVNGAKPGESSIRENVQTLIGDLPRKEGRGCGIPRA